MPSTPIILHDRANSRWPSALTDGMWRLSPTNPLTPHTYPSTIYSNITPGPFPNVKQVPSTRISWWWSERKPRSGSNPTCKRETLLSYGGSHHHFFEIEPFPNHTNHIPSILYPYSIMGAPWDLPMHPPSFQELIVGSRRDQPGGCSEKRQRVAGRSRVVWGSIQSADSTRG